ncbi:MAG: DM13 domain-containing protein [candidate division Zixibacteria bacterium]|nr:DM13 domain-containing protein [candidate division Zixibacteria bacterium]
MFFDSLGVERVIPIAWASPNPSIASVGVSDTVLDTRGHLAFVTYVRGHQVGQVNITASCQGVISPAVRLMVVADLSTQVASVSVTPDSVHIAVGDTVRLQAVAHALNGQPLSGRTFTWQTTHTTVASVDAGGLVTGVTAGTTGITAVTDGVTGGPVFVRVPASAVEGRSGAFTRRPGSGYVVQGTAALEKIAPDSDRLVLKFGADFNVSSGPGIEVFLSRSNTVGSGSVGLGRVKRLSGAQSYEVPQGVSLQSYDWVIIHCVPFNVVFGYAQFQ